MKIKEAEGNAKIKQAYANAVPDICGVILSECEQKEGKVIVMTEEKKKRGFIKYLMAAASLVLVLGAGALLTNVYRLNYAVSSTVSLDVNPSIQITVNEKERVLEVKALNKDGGIVIGDMDFEGSDIDVTMNALIGSMLRKGYLNELANSILISVDNNDPAKGEQLQEKLTEKVNELLESDGFFGAVLGQTIRENGNLQQLAEQYGITQGKAQLIQQILDSTTGHTFEELAPLTINELNLIISTGTSSVEKVSSLGYASDKAYIGEDKAKETAFAHAGVSGQDILFYEMDMDLEKGVMVYEIEFKCGGFEYEYDIDAQTGEIIKNKKEVDDDFPAGSQASSGKTDDPAAGSQSPEPGTKTPDAGSQTPASGTNTPAAGTQSPGGNTATPPSSPQDGVGNAGGTSGILTLEQAKEIALNHAGQSASNVYFDKVELDHDHGMQKYEIEFIAGSTEYDYEIDAVTGAILKYDWDQDDDHMHISESSGNGAGGAVGTITSEQAKEIALNHAGQSASGVYFDKVELDYDDGIQKYEVEFVSGNMEYDYEIDAITGAILKYDWDQD